MKAVPRLKQRAQGFAATNPQRKVNTGRPYVLLKPIAAAAPDTALAPSDYTTLGKSGLRVPVMGVGAWSWGDRSGYWGYGKEYGKEESRAAYKVGSSLCQL